MARIGANASLSKRDRATSLRLTLAESGNAGLNLSECASVINCTNYKGIIDLIALITERDLNASEIKTRVNFEILTRRDAGAPSVTRRVRLEPRDITAALENATKPTSTLNPSQWNAWGANHQVYKGYLGQDGFMTCRSEKNNPPMQGVGETRFLASFASRPTEDEDDIRDIDEADPYIRDRPVEDVSEYNIVLPRDL
jgi:hypothetical protein